MCHPAPPEPCPGPAVLDGPTDSTSRALSRLVVRMLGLLPDTFAVVRRVIPARAVRRGLAARALAPADTSVAGRTARGAHLRSWNGSRCAGSELFGLSSRSWMPMSICFTVIDGFHPFCSSRMLRQIVPEGYTCARGPPAQISAVQSQLSRALWAEPSGPRGAHVRVEEAGHKLALWRLARVLVRKLHRDPVQPALPVGALLPRHGAVPEHEVERAILVAAWLGNEAMRVILAPVLALLSEPSTSDASHGRGACTMPPRSAGPRQAVLDTPRPATPVNTGQGASAVTGERARSARTKQSAHGTAHARLFFIRR